MDCSGWIRHKLRRLSITRGMYDQVSLRQTGILIKVSKVSPKNFKAAFEYKFCHVRRRFGQNLCIDTRTDSALAEMAKTQIRWASCNMILLVTYDFLNS
ncbi:MAG: hypothetical protein NTU41_00715 [Chloroflexi bacterium]|nr:hypothetical protein [Chloroflexota bacterium]